MEKLNTSGYAIFTLKLNNTGNYTLYAVFPEQAIYSRSRSTNVSIEVIYPVNPMGSTPIVSREHYIVILMLFLTTITLLALIAKRKGVSLYLFFITFLFFTLYIHTQEYRAI